MTLEIIPYVTKFITNIKSIYQKLYTLVITEKLKLKVQPVVLLGTREILDSHNFCANFFGNVKVVYLPLVDTTDKDWLEKTRSKMQEILDENLHEDSNELPDANENLNETKTDKISEK